MNDPRFPEEGTDAGARIGTRIPTVGDLAEIVASSRAIPPERRSELFQAARQVCAEELRMVRTGFAPAPLVDLAARVVRLLPSEIGGERYPGWSWDQDAPFPEEPLDDSVPAFSPDDPFGGGGVIASDALPPGFSAADEESDSIDEAEEKAREDAREEEDESEEISFAMRDDVPAPPRGGKLAAFLLFVAIAGSVYFFAQTRRARPTATIPPALTPEGESSPLSPSEKAPSSAHPPVDSARALAPPVVSGPVPPPAAPSVPVVPDVPESRGATMISADWAGHPAAFMIHFSSYQKKENADRDAARLSKLLGRPMRVIGVNLGPAGHWYRVMLGEFSSREEADAYRSDLAAKGTPGMGLVYRVSASPADGVSASPAEKVSALPADRVSPPPAR